MSIKSAIKWLAGVALVGVVFLISVAFFGSWWRADSLPTAEEWSAFFGASALAAILLAYRQVKQVDESNRELILSNKHARLVNVESVRPRVQVALETDRIVKRVRGGRQEAQAYVSIKNIGVSPARNVRLAVTPSFTSLEIFFNPNMMAEYLEKMNAVFAGDVYYSHIRPGASYIWFLGRLPELFDDETGLPRRYTVTASYEGDPSYGAFSDEFVLDLDIEKHIEAPVDPLVRIGKDLEFVGKQLEGIQGVAKRGISISSGTRAFVEGVVEEWKLRADRANGKWRKR
jgi:hypothetical protein